MLYLTTMLRTGCTLLPGYTSFTKWSVYN